MRDLTQCHAVTNIYACMLGTFLEYAGELSTYARGVHIAQGGRACPYAAARGSCCFGHSRILLDVTVSQLAPYKSVAVSVTPPRCQMHDSAGFRIHLPCLFTKWAECGQGVKHGVRVCSFFAEPRTPRPQPTARHAVHAAHARRYWPVHTLCTRCMYTRLVRDGS